jgi:S-adenosyl-L-methionine hydrolase (adenosine-forming)
MPSPIITLLTDFGTADAFVGIMKGVILGIDPQARVVDLTHAVPPQQVLPAALLLHHAVPFFPPGTIHVAVVDPGVGTGRRALLIETAHGLLVGPDNGVLSLAAAGAPRRVVRHLTNAALFRHPVSQTFHGRDVFAPVAAHLARGADPAACGPVVDAIVELRVAVAHQSARQITGEVVYTDRFGNLLTNIAADALSRFPAHALSVSIRATRVAGPVQSYAAVAPGMPLAIVGSWGMLEIAVRNGSAADSFAAEPGTPVTVAVESQDA